MTKLTLLAITGLCAVQFATAQPSPTPAVVTAITSAAGIKPPDIPKPTTGPKAYKDVITEKAKTTKGLFTVHKVEDKYYFEIANSNLFKEFLAVTRFSKTAWGGGVYGGEKVNSSVLRFEKGPNNNIFLRYSLNVVSSPDSSTPMFKAVKNSTLDPIVNSFEIKCFSKDSSGVVIEVTDFFKGDNQVVSLDQFSRRRINLSSLSSDRSYIESIKTFPKNTEIRTVKTFSSSPAGFSFGAPSPFPSATLPAANAAGAVTLELNTSFIQLPEKPMKRRMFDNRVGYFADDVITFDNAGQRAEEEVFAVRYRLEPKPQDIERYKKGELVEPLKQIVYYIDPATPKQWRGALIQGINDWNVAFEKAGWKNAIVGKEWPENDSTMSLEDARYSVLRYFASDIENAYGPNVHDPRSGEIMESHIGWYHNVMKLLRNWYLVQCAAVDPDARKMKYDDDLMAQLIRFVSSHEVGHTLGLRHNMGASSKTPIEMLRNKAWVEANGHTSSIMDYARFNYVAQPEDNISKIGLFPRIGDYDKWAIEWGYRWNDKDEAGDKVWSNNAIIAAVKNPRLWFGGEGQNPDPRAQTEDLGDNAMKASDYGVKNLKRIVPNLLTWTKEEGDKYENLNEVYGQVISQFRRYAGHVLKNVGGYYETLKSTDETGDIYSITPKATQKEAMAWVSKNVFETPTWLIDKAIWNKIATVNDDPIISLQEGALASLLNSSRLARVALGNNRDATAYNLDELMQDTKKAVFAELTTNKPTDYYRRTLQKSMVEKLNGILEQLKANPNAFFISFGSGQAFDVKRSDIPSVTRGLLTQLQAETRAAAARSTDKLSKYHYQDIAERIKQVLEPR